MSIGYLTGYTGAAPATTAGTSAAVYGNYLQGVQAVNQVLSQANAQALANSYLAGAPAITPADPGTLKSIQDNYYAENVAPSLAKLQTPLTAVSRRFSSRVTWPPNENHL
jgi:hypothetical protein